MVVHPVAVGTMEFGTITFDDQDLAAARLVQLVTGAWPPVSFNSSPGRGRPRLLRRNLLSSEKAA